MNHTQLCLLAASHPEIPNHFVEWLRENEHIWIAFRDEALKMTRLGYQHYSSKTIMEYLRHHSVISENSDEFKLAQQVYHSNPWFASSPEGELYAAAIAKAMAPEKKKEAPKEKADSEDKAKSETIFAKSPPKAPSDQAAVSAAGAVARVSPEVQRRNTLGADLEKLRAKKGATARDAAAFLAKREQLNSQR